MNTMARYGVIGNGIQIQVTPEFVEAFAAIDVTLTNEMGEVFDRARGSALMGNPFKAILWLVNHLKEHNKICLFPQFSEYHVINCYYMGILTPRPPLHFMARGSFADVFPFSTTWGGVPAGRGGETNKT